MKTCELVRVTVVVRDSVCRDVVFMFRVVAFVEISFKRSNVADFPELNARQAGGGKRTGTSTHTRSKGDSGREWAGSSENGFFPIAINTTIAARSSTHRCVKTATAWHVDALNANANSAHISTLTSQNHHFAARRSRSAAVGLPRTTRPTTSTPANHRINPHVGTT